MEVTRTISEFALKCKKCSEMGLINCLEVFLTVFNYHGLILLAFIKALFVKQCNKQIKKEDIIHLCSVIRVVNIF
jgi:hypothetical protein